MLQPVMMICSPGVSATPSIHVRLAAEIRGTRTGIKLDARTIGGAASSDAMEPIRNERLRIVTLPSVHIARSA